IVLRSTPVSVSRGRPAGAGGPPGPVRARPPGYYGRERGAHAAHDIYTFELVKICSPMRLVRARRRPHSPSTPERRTPCRPVSEIPVPNGAPPIALLATVLGLIGG